MFSLVISIIALALLVTTLLVGGYYGGTAILDSRASTEASRLQNEGQQIMGAADVFRVENRSWPVSISALVDSGALRAPPQGLSVEKAGTAGWSAVVAGEPIYWTSDAVPQRVCRKFNLISRGDDGILRVPYSILPAQCYGEKGAYRIVIAKIGADILGLKTALPNPVLEGGLPLADGGDAWWDVSPDGAVKAPLDPNKTPTALLTLSAATLNFGLVPVGEVSGIQTLTLSNTGNRDLTGLTGYHSPAGFDLEQDTCSSSLAAGASCSMGVVFRPNTAKSFETSLQFPSSSPQAAILSLKGSGAQAALVCTGPGETSCDLAFGDVALGATVESGLLTLRNTGNLELAGLHINLPASLSVSNSTCTDILSSGASCEFSVTFAPTNMGDLAGHLTVSGSDEQQASYSVTGRGTSVSLTSNLELTQDIGVGPALANHFARYTLTNSGNMPVTLKSLSVVQGAGFASLGSCVVDVPLAPRASCAVDIGFPPSQVASDALGVMARLESSAGEKMLSVSGSSRQLSWNLVSKPPEVALGQPAEHVLDLVNSAPTTFVFGGGLQAEGKFTVNGADWFVSSTSCGASLPAGGRCQVVLTLTATMEDADMPVALRPVGYLRDFANRVETAEVHLAKFYTEFTTTAKAKRVDYSSLVASMVNPTFEQQVAIIPSLGAGYSLTPGGTKALALSAWGMGRNVVVSGNVPVKAKLQYYADDSITNLRVNGKPVPTPAAADAIQESGEFTLLPGVNSVVFTYTNLWLGGTIYARIIESPTGSLITPTSGWKYAGAPVLISVYSDGTAYRYTDGTVLESCNAYKTPAAGYAVANIDGPYYVKPGSSTVAVYCAQDAAHAGGGWTMVMTNDLPNFTNRAATGTSKVCLTPTGCNTVGTSTLYSGTPVEGTISDFMFLATNNGNIWGGMSAVMARPANFIRDNTSAPGVSLYVLMTDSHPGWSPPESTQGTENDPARIFSSSSGHVWSDGNWHSEPGRQGMQMVDLNGWVWGHHDYHGDAILENGQYRVNPWTHGPYFLDGAIKLVPQADAISMYRWLVFVR